MSAYCLLLFGDSVYRIPEAEQPFYVANIQSGDSGVSFWSPSKMSIVAVLGETAVDFTFASPVSLDPVRRLQQELHTDACVAIWPVYFLRGNGDIMVTYSDVIHNRWLMWTCPVAYVCFLCCLTVDLLFSRSVCFFMDTGLLSLIQWHCSVS